MGDKLNILLQCDNNYAPFAGVMLMSLFVNNIDVNDIMVYFLSMDISLENRRRFNYLAEQYNRNIDFLDTSALNAFFESKALPKWRGSYTAYYKMLAIPMIGEDIEKIIYIDSDVIINGSLSGLNDMDLGNNILGMGIDIVSEAYKNMIHYKKNVYYNTGVVLFDVRKWKRMNCTERIINYINTEHSKYSMPDQDLFNLIFYKEIKELPQIYNLHAGLLVYQDYKFIKSIYGVQNWYSEKEWEEAKKNAVVLHCMGGICERPWVEGSDHPAKELWNQYLQKSPWSDFVPVKQKMDFSLKLMRVLFQILPHKLYAFVYRNILLIRQKYRCKKLGV